MSRAPRPRTPAQAVRGRRLGPSAPGAVLPGRAFLGRAFLGGAGLLAAGLLAAGAGGASAVRAAEAPAGASSSSVAVPSEPAIRSRPSPYTPSPYASSGDDVMMPMLAETIVLRRAVDVMGPFVTLGDLFEGVGDKADIAVARAPRPGRSATLDAPWLEQAARAHGLPWSPRSALEQTVVTRPGVTVPQEMIEQALVPVLTNLGAPPSMSLEITTARSTLSVPPGEPPTVRVLEETYDPVTRRFTAVIEAPAGAPDAQRVQMAGRFVDTRDVPVLVRRMGRGERIRPEDLSSVRVRADALPPDVLTDPSEVIGMEIRGAPRDGHPLRRVDVSRPVVVRKDSFVTMELRMPGLLLTAQGKALEAGGEGEAIRVSNLVSKQVVMGTVTGPGRVVITAPGAVRPQTASR